MEVFGSYVRGEDNDQSDLDILIEFSDETGLGLLEFIRLENELGELFSVKSRFSHERYIKGKT
jgi:predicted nucleotidyltransferase